MKLDSLIFKVSRSLGLDDTQLTDEFKLMQMWANEAVVDFLARTRLYAGSTPWNLTAGQDEYRIQTDFGNVLAVLDGFVETASGTAPYEVISIAEMYAIRAANPSAGGTRKFIATDGDYLVVSPVPAESETIWVLTVPRPTPLVDEADLGSMPFPVPDPASPGFGGIPYEFHRALEFYMLWRGAEYDEKNDQAYGKGAAQGFLDRYLDEIKLAKKIMRQKGLKRGMHGAPRAGYPGSTRLTGRNDIYPER